MDVSSKLRRILGSEAVWLAAIPFVGSLLSLAFEAGYLLYYGIPVTFIHLDLPQIAAASVFVMLLGSMLTFFFELIIAIGRGSHPVRQAFVSPLVRGFIFFPFVMLIPYSSVKWLYFAGLVLVLALLEFVPPLFSRSGGPYLSRLAAQVKESRSAEELKDSFGEHIKGMLGVSMLIGLLVVFLGYNYASEKDRYFVLGGENLAMITNYGDLVLFKPFEPATGRLVGGFTVMRLDSSRLTLAERTGRLVKRNKGDGGS